MPRQRVLSRILLSDRHGQYGYEAVLLFRDYGSKTCMAQTLKPLAFRYLIFRCKHSTFRSRFHPVKLFDLLLHSPPNPTLRRCFQNCARLIPCAGRGGSSVNSCFIAAAANHPQTCCVTSLFSTTIPSSRANSRNEALSAGGMPRSAAISPALLLPSRFSSSLK